MVVHVCERQAHALNRGSLFPDIQIFYSTSISGGALTPHPPPSVQFKLYQGEVLQYKPGASDHRCVRMDLALVQIDLYQGLGGIHPVRLATDLKAGCTQA